MKAEYLIDYYLNEVKATKIKDYVLVWLGIDATAKKLGGKPRKISQTSRVYEFSVKNNVKTGNADKFLKIIDASPLVKYRKHKATPFSRIITITVNLP